MHALQKYPDEGIVVPSSHAANELRVDPASWPLVGAKSRIWAGWAVPMLIGRTVPSQGTQLMMATN